MKSNFKVQGLAVIVCLLLALISITQTVRQSDTVTGLIQSNTQLAAISGAGSGLVAHYTFDDGTATDSSGNGNNGTITGATAVAGKLGQALSFNGIDNYVNLSSIPVSSFPFTICGWFKPTQTGVNQTLFSFLNSGNSGSRRHHLIKTNSDNTLLLHAYDNTIANNINTLNTQKLNEWNFVCGIWASDSDRVIILNNDLDNKGSSNVAVTFNNPAVTRIGHGNLSYEAAFNGHIDDVRIYSRALSVTEISEIYSLGLGSIQSPINGVCGLAAKQYSDVEAFPSGSYCSSGVVNPISPANPVQGGSSSWSCDGLNNGISASCSASRLIPILRDTTAPTISNIQTNPITETNAIISWTTDEPSDTQVEYGLNTSYDSLAALDSAFTISHSQTLSSLLADTIYHYRTISKDSSGNIARSSDQLFRTNRASIGPTCNSISQFGITWFFDTSYPCGTFANGDYWVKGPITIIRITPDFDGTKNGWEVNPAVSNKQGFDGRVSSFNSVLVPNLPYTSIAPIESIVKTISAPENKISYIQTAAVLTILPSIPPNNGVTVFRPPYMGTNKPIYKISDLHTEYLSSLSPVGTPPSLEAVASRYRYLRLEHLIFDQRSFRPRDAYDRSTDGYGPETSRFNAEDILRLLLNDPLTNKMTALIGVTQHGIDQAHAVISGLRLPGTGHDPGHIMMASFAATMLNITEAKAVLLNVTGFEEDVFTTLGVKGISLWGLENSESAYWNYIRGNGGNRGNKDPYGFIDGGKNGADYQLILSQSYKGSVLVGSLIPQISTTAWNPKEWSILSEYVKRWVKNGTWSQPDPCAPYSVEGTYGVDYGPDSNNPGMCILDSDLSYYNNSTDFACKVGKECGRYPSKHGTSIDGGQYRSNFVAAMWNAYGPNSGNPPTPPIPPTPCTSFTYSSWSTCSNGTQTRSILTSSPVGCTGGSPILTQSCTVTPTPSPTHTLPTPTPTPTPPPVIDTTSPTISITSPISGTISGTVTLSATASDNIGIVGVQFKLDNLNIGTELNTAPYSGAWNTVGVSNGTHTLTAIARDAAGNTKTSSSVTITVSNTIPTPTPTPTSTASPTPTPTPRPTSSPTTTPRPSPTPTPKPTLPPITGTFKPTVTQKTIAPPLILSTSSEPLSDFTVIEPSFMDVIRNFFLYIIERIWNGINIVKGEMGRMLGR